MRIVVIALFIASALAAAWPGYARNADGTWTARIPLAGTDDWHTVGTDTAMYWTGTCTRDEINNLHGKTDNVIKVEHIVWLNPPQAETTRCGWMKFNTTSIPDSATILNARIRYLVHFWQFSFDFQFTALDLDPVTAGARDLYQAIGAGAACADLPMPRLWDTTDLNAAGVAHVQNSLGRNWVAFGLWGYGWSRVLTEQAWITGWNNNPRDDSPWLDVDYSVTGVEEPPGRVPPESPQLPTICRGVLLLPRSSFDTRHSTLLDASGRRVLDLNPGPNDIRQLSPGMYFVREHPASSSQHSGPTTTHKVIVTR